MNIFERLLGANWKTTLSMWGATLMGALTFIASLSYDQGPLSMVFSPEYKPIITKVAGIAAIILFFYNGVQQKSKNVTGGNVQQTEDGSLAKPGTQTLVDLTRQSPPK